MNLDEVTQREGVEQKFFESEVQLNVAGGKHPIVLIGPTLNL